MSLLNTSLASPLAQSLVVGLVACVLGWRGARRGAVGLGLLACAWLWVWSMPLASVAVLRSMEAAYPPLALESMPSAPAMVVLGGGMAPRSAGRPHADLLVASDRVWHAARLYRAGKAPRVLLSGGAAVPPYASSEAEAMREFIVDLGVPPGAVALEPESRNTRENAAFSARWLRQQRIDRVLLVTSALHMRRAAEQFEAEGIRVIPAATDHTPPRAAGTLGWLPDPDALEGSGRAMKEWLGGLAAGAPERPR